MPHFTPIPLGQPIPDRPHAVSCSLPTMHDVIGYEEKDPETLRHIASGYPRFVQHAYVQQLTERCRTILELDDTETLWLTCSHPRATELVTELGTGARCELPEGFAAVVHPNTPELNLHARRYLQNVGGFLGSRLAELELASQRLRPAATEELAPLEDAADIIREVLVEAHVGTTADDILLAPSGMNAFHGAWRSLADLQAERGRTVWIQLGWLYLDTIAQLQRFTATPADYVALPDVNNLDALQQTIDKAGDRLAGLVTEVPTNPLVHTADIAEVAARVHRAGGRMLLDPTLVSPFNIRLLEHSDVVVNSLTKYAANEGDVIAGSVIINPAGSDANELRARIADRLDPVFNGDLQRLAAQIPAYRETVERTNATATQVVDYLRQHPTVERVWWSLQPDTADNYAKIARSPDSIGSMISFTVKRPLAEVYDRMPLPKGPSFGMRTTLLCPFIYLAHYDLVTSEEGRAQLAAAGIPVDLLRLSVGMEPVDAIIAALAAGLD
jgi:cystathionine gamma-synthase